MNSESFVDAVARRSGCSAVEVSDLLTNARVPTRDTGGTPHRLRITRLAFTGKKAGVSSDDINFEQGFDDGLWALTTEKNDRGKTSVLEIMMWALRGEPKRLQDDVRSWLSSVTLSGTIGAVSDYDLFTVKFKLTDGVPSGALTCDGEDRAFASDAAFADTMSSFMMKRLGFDSFPQWVNNRGVSTHGWSLYATALYMHSEARDAVIGGITQAGLPQRLLQLFIGVPWGRTLIASQAALKEMEAKASNQQDSTKAIQEVTNKLRNNKRQELEAKKAEIAQLPADLPTDGQVETARTELLDLISKHAEAKEKLQEAIRDKQTIQRESVQRKKQLNDLAEAAIAQRLFHGLDPVTCPRCSIAIGTDRKQTETNTHLCALCNRHMGQVDIEIDDSAIDDEDADEPRTIEEFQQLVTEIEHTVEAEQARVEELTTQVEALKHEIVTAKNHLDSYVDQMVQIRQRRDLEAQVAALETVIADLGDLPGEESGEAPAPHSPDSSLDDWIRILNAAVVEAKKRRNDGFKEMDTRINEAILDLAQRFGFDNLQDIRLNLAAQLRLTKGGVNTWFSKQTPGEKLRLRIAVNIALLRVAHEMSIGRHPGLLMIDSIGAEETEPGDLAKFMSELVNVTAELGMETIVASARPEILDYVPENHRITAIGDDYLW